jgi:hypothetical protein
MSVGGSGLIGHGQGVRAVEGWKAAGLFDRDLVCWR